MPMKFSLELMTVVCLNSMNPKWKSFGNIIQEINGICLVMPLINLQCSCSCSIINSCILISSNFLTILLKIQEFNVYLNSVTGKLLFISLKMHYRPFSHIYREPIHIIAEQNLPYSSWRDLYVVIPV